jgi:beta-glucuronidase
LDLTVRRTVLIAAIALLALIGSAAAHAATWYQDGPAGSTLLDGQWLYRADPDDQGLSQNWQSDLTTDAWSPVTIPNAWNANSDDNSKASMNGSVGWYRRDFLVDPSQLSAETQWIVRFESVNYFATVYLNGQELGEHEGASIPFEYVLKNLQPGVNSLVVRVDSRRTRTSIPASTDSGWWNYGGILREVYLRRVNQVDIASLLTRTLSPNTLLVRATLDNPIGGTKRVFVTLIVNGRKIRLNPTRVNPYYRTTVGTKVYIPNAKLWAPRKPHLYKVQAVAWVKNQKVATYTVHTGLRLLKIRKDGRMLMNGLPLNLRGADIHEQTVAHGAALTPEDHAAQINGLLALHADFTRAHYPLSEDFLERADRAGIAVWEEIPMWQMPETALRNPVVRQKALDYLAQTIRRDQNHPSVIAWSIGNELPNDPGPGQETYIRQAAALVHKLDPTRPAALAVAADPTVNENTAYSPVDVLGINEYFGWFGGTNGATSSTGPLGQYLDRMHSFYKHKALFVTEFGAEATRSGPATDRGTYDFQENYLQAHLSTFASKKWLNGALTWILQDFRVRPGWTGGNPDPDPPWVHKGLIDANGVRRPAFSSTSQEFAEQPALIEQPAAAGSGRSARGK